MRPVHEQIPLHEAEYAVLMFGEGRVHVRAIREEIDGSFTGEIYGYEGPPESVYGQIPIGDTLNFRETHVFTYSAPRAAAMAAFEDETPEPDEPGAQSSRRRDRMGLDDAEPPAPASSGPRGLRYAMIAAVAAVIAAPLGYMWAAADLPDARRAHATTPVSYPGLRLDYELRRP